MTKTGALLNEANEMALQIINGNRDEVRDFILNHDQPVHLVLSIIRYHSYHTKCDTILSVVNIQGLLEFDNV